MPVRSRLDPLRDVKGEPPAREGRVIAPNADYAALIAGIAATPARLEALVASTARDAWTRRPDNGGFSLLEHVCHLRDIDADGYCQRVERILTEAWPDLPEIDGDALAEQRDYQNLDLMGALTSFCCTRRQLARRLSGLVPAERCRAGRLAGHLEVTIEGLVHFMLAHDREHLWQLEALCTGSIRVATPGNRAVIRPDATSKTSR